MKRLLWTGALGLALGMATVASARQLYGSDFQNDTIGQTPKGWEKGFEGKGTATVIKDPKDANNKVLQSLDVPAAGARHDVGGSIYVVGSPDWTDYIVQYDALFPEEYYEGVVFRFVEDNSFYLFDRRSGGEAGKFDLWTRAGGGWTRIQGGADFPTKIQTWYRFRIVVNGEKFDAYAAEMNDKTAFADMKPFLSGANNQYKKGRFGLYGLVYVDNVIVGESEADMALAVEPAGKLASTWAQLKAR